MAHDHRRHSRLGVALAVVTASLMAASSASAAPPNAAAKADPPARFIDMNDMLINGGTAKPTMTLFKTIERVRWGSWLRITPKNLKPAMAASASELLLK